MTQSVVVEELPETGKALAPTNGAMTTAGSVTDLLRMAIDRGIPVEQFEKLVALHRDIEKHQAEREFFAAFAAFQAECPPIKKTNTANIATRSGAKFSYTFAPLDEIARTVNPFLTRNAFSYSWDTKVEGNSLTKICTLRHAAGHSITSTASLPIDTAAGMSDQQKVAAAGTFAERMSLRSVLGLTTTDDDTDGESVKAMDPTKISDDQVTALNDLVVEVKADLPRFLKFMSVEKLADITVGEYQRAVTALEQKRPK